MKNLVYKDEIVHKFFQENKSNSSILKLLMNDYNQTPILIGATEIPENCIIDPL